ncbi:hypothetical protein BLL42_27640 (plasmid) [Pseudomonas frederiksbergensis]|uniref:Uncharacterized protein n=1 Tax=Pseudomonas frederiksbergensis TaxID=104087 RepID=A0A1J0EUP4_9PSED|nr:hypothetical protein [Pseudomonas frederiksbergensis]APC19508.1 hypothetical protein BLL42_27640 [Pseudomonas frederiksbergensis]
MSTKIYNGLILQDSSIEQALKHLVSIKPRCVDAAEKAAAKVCAREMTFSVDLAANFCVLGEKIQPYRTWKLIEKFDLPKVSVLGKGVRNTEWDFTFDVCLIPANGNVLAIYSVESDLGYREALLSVGFKDYHYQNSTDRPEDISEDEWVSRQEAWDSALPGRTAPGAAGLIYSVVSWDDYSLVFYNPSLIHAQIPSTEHRKSRVARRLSELEICASQPKVPLSEIIDRILERVPLRQPDVLLGEIRSEY